MSQTEIEAHLQALARILQDCKEQMAQPDGSAHDHEVMDALRTRFEARRASFEAALALIPTRAAA